MECKGLVETIRLSLLGAERLLAFMMIPKGRSR